MTYHRDLLKLEAHFWPASQINEKQKHYMTKKKEKNAIAVPQPTCREWSSCNLSCPPPAGADFTNTFRSLSQISCPTEGEGEEGGEHVKKASDLLLEQCATLEELKAANKPTMDPRWAAYTPNCVSSISYHYRWHSGKINLQVYHGLSLNDLAPNFKTIAIFRNIKLRPVLKLYLIFDYIQKLWFAKWRFVFKCKIKLDLSVIRR